MILETSRRLALIIKALEKDHDDNLINNQVGGCGENQVCAQEEEGELMGEIFNASKFKKDFFLL